MTLATLTADLQPATLIATAAVIEIPLRAIEGDQDRVTQGGDERVTEAWVEASASLGATLQPASLVATGRIGRSAILEGVYYRVTERSPSSLHPALGGDVTDPAPGGELSQRTTEQSSRRVPGEIDHRILQHQLLGTLRLVAEASVRTHVAERHFLWASRARIECVAARSRIQLRGRSDFRKTRANG